MGRPLRVALLTLLALTSPFAAAQESSAQFEWLREYLAEFSIVSDAAPDGAREVLSTRLEPHPEPGLAVIRYQRESYRSAGADRPEIRQIIHYTVRLDDLDTETISVQPWQGPHSGRERWLVRVVIDADADYVPYTNVFERSVGPEAVDVTSSRGRVREVVLGYFETQTQAARLADSFRDLLERGAQQSA